MREGAGKPGEGHTWEDLKVQALGSFLGQWEPDWVL